MNWKNSNKQKIKKPTWGAFRSFWTDCDITITPHLRGFVDIEGGAVGVSNKWLPICQECFGSVKCEKCGRNLKNTLQIRAGDGDGVYPVFQLTFEEEIVGGLCLFDEGAQMAPNLINSILETSENIEEDLGFLGEYYTDFYSLFYNFIENYDKNLKMYFAGEIKVVPIDKNSKSGMLLIGESFEGADSNQSIIALRNMPVGNYKLFVFGDRDSLNGNIIVPRALLILESKSAAQIGLIENFCTQLNMEEEVNLWNKSLVLSRIGEPAAPYALNANWNLAKMELIRKSTFAETTEDELLILRLESLSWVLMINHHLKDREFKKTVTAIMADYKKHVKTIHNLRGQLNRNLI